MLKNILKRPWTAGLFIFLFAIVGRYLYMLPKFDEGVTAPDFFITINETGDSVYLSSLRGNLVLLDFWGSWCPPCRKDHAALVKLYQRSKTTSIQPDAYLEIVSIGIEKSKKAWSQAIKNDQLSWPYHLFDKSESLRFFNSPIAIQYGVKQLPSRYLIDENQKIIAVNPSIEYLTDLLLNHPLVQ